MLLGLAIASPKTPNLTLVHTPFMGAFTLPVQLTLESYQSLSSLYHLFLFSLY